MDAHSPESTPTERRQRAEALAATRRAEALALRRAGRRFIDIARALGVTLERARRITYEAERRAFDPHWYDNLPLRAVHVLRAHELLDRPESEAVRAVAQFSARELMHRENFGRVSLNALSDWLAGHGLKLQPETKPGAPAKGRPFDSIDPLTTGRNEFKAPCPYPTMKT